MSTGDAALLSPSCPDRTTLAAFHQGKLSEPVLETVAAHVSTCPPCSAALDEVQQELHSDGSLLGRLRECLKASTVGSEEGCARLEVVARAISLSSRHDAQTTVAGSDSAPASPPTQTGSNASRLAEQTGLPARIGPYEVLGRLGQGGMGVVYKARQRSVNRLVAVKMVLAGAHASDQIRARFHIEGEAIARLRHPHVVQLFDFGEHDGLPYYSMELMEGGSLSARLSKEPMPARAAAELVMALGGAVEAAHQAHVLHRDLKPSNVLLTAGGEPKIADFGLAKLRDSDHGHTAGEALLGTPSYMAPEQAAGRHEDVGPATDVYALGAILYEALTGRPPFKTKDRTLTLRHVLRTAPRPPSTLVRSVPRVLEAICLKCLAKAPARRYASAHALVDDLERFLRGEPTLARPPTWPTRALAWSRRHALVLSSLAVLVAIPAVLYWRDPERIVEQARRDLSQMRPVTLLAATGPPLRCHWLEGEAESTLSEAADGTFRVGAAKNVPCLLELLADPGIDHYRISVELHHLSGDPQSMCGVFFGHQSLPFLSGRGHCYLSVAFGDLYTFSDSLDRVQAKVPPEVRNKMRATTTNRVRVDQHCCLDVPDTRRIDWRGSVALQGASADFTPGGPMAPWRHLEIDISPEALTVVFDKTMLVGQVSLTDHLRWRDADARSAQKNEPRKAEFLSNLPRSFPGRASIGIYLLGGFASFRNFVVTPLRASS